MLQRKKNLYRDGSVCIFDEFGHVRDFFTKKRAVVWAIMLYTTDTPYIWDHMRSSFT